MLSVALFCVVSLSYWAYRIRMQAIDEYGRVIHEFDPYFNYRATEVRFCRHAGERESKMASAEKVISNHSSLLLLALHEYSISINMELRSSFSGLITWSGEYEKNEWSLFIVFDERSIEMFHF